MKSFVAVLVLAALASAASIDSFREWAKTHGKVYSGIEESRRFAIFKENLAIIERLNLENHGATFGANQFSDLTNAEFASLYTSKMNTYQPGNFEVIPDSVTNDADFRSRLPEVKDQAQCGSCWAFSAIQNAEGQQFAKLNKVVSLSEQQLVSCDTGNSACDGGLMTTADTYILKHGLTTEAEYPYTSASGSVAACKAFTKEYTFTSSKDFKKVSSDATMISHVDEYGPISVAIDGAASVFQSYKSGVLDSTACGTTLNHGVGLVGYGTDEDSGKAYWLVRNSWGKTWGEKGYIKLVRGKNQCGINGMVSTIVA